MIPLAPMASDSIAHSEHSMLEFVVMENLKLLLCSIYSSKVY